MHVSRTFPRTSTLVTTIAALMAAILCIEASINYRNNRKFKPATARHPIDYAYSSHTSRVSDLVDFFESTRGDKRFEEIKKIRDSIISLSEAATKLHAMSQGQLLRVKCLNYIKLIERPNIRTDEKLGSLVNEEHDLNSIPQNEANLVARLMSERRFDALGKLQTLVQSLESESDNSRSTYEPEVQKDILDCIVYFTRRHQEATEGLAEYVRSHLENLGQATDGSSTSNIKFDLLINKIQELENDDHMDERIDQWIEAVVKLRDLVKKTANISSIPSEIYEFLADPGRWSRLSLCEEIVSHARSLKDRALALEHNEPLMILKRQEVYERVLVELFELVEANKSLIPQDISSFAHDPKRLKLIQGDLKRNKTN